MPQLIARSTVVLLFQLVPHNDGLTGRGVGPDPAGRGAPTGRTVRVGSSCVPSASERTSALSSVQLVKSRASCAQPSRDGTAWNRPAPVLAANLPWP